MIRCWAVLALAAAPLAAQVNPARAEQEDLQRAVTEAGNSPVEFVRAVERHLSQFPDAPRKAELERAVLKYAIDLNDDRRTIQYGERVIAREPNDAQVLSAVATALLRQGDPDGARRALEYAAHLDELIQATYKDDKFSPSAGREEGKRKEDFDRGRARALILQARAEGVLGHNDKATEFAEASYHAYPSVEGAREASRWLAASGHNQEALHYLAYAFSIAGLNSASADGAADRAKLRDLYQKVKGSETGLGDLILQAYDDSAKLLAARRDAMKQYDPNAQIKDPLQFTLAGLDGDKLALASLAGKVIVLDFWATWCAPCRVQHPLYEEVKTRYKDNSDVVFLAVDADEDRSLVKPFLDSMQWSKKIYFEDGLSSALQVSSIPTTVIFGKKGEMVSRMIGFLPDRFVDMLTERIDDALGKPVKPAPVPPQVKVRPSQAIQQ